MKTKRAERPFFDSCYFVVNIVFSLDFNAGGCTRCRQQTLGGFYARLYD